ncbi:3-dehydroquinate synthase [Clostridiaceae bacterium HSG29]|nr:3-dehydroquinate synthase [Clostridiaceae bacterium HSG29]
MKNQKNEYQIIIEKGIFKNLNKIIKSYSYSKCVIITDKNIYEIYKEDIDNLNFEVVVIEPGEKSKNINTYEVVINKLLNMNFNREDIIVSIGGGVVGDLSGFIASTILRGVRYIQVPTTLLSQVDSSIGGKVAVNSLYGKNLIGSFYHPLEVIVDPEFLKTLPKREVKSGMGELIKHAMIKDKNLFNLLNEYKSFDELYENIEEILFISLNIKKEIVEIDEFDKGLRMILNFGHTIGHAIEKSFDEDFISHGEAVSFGMVHILEIFGKKEISEKLKALLIKYDIINNYDYNIKKIFKFIENDKKIMKDIINIVVVDKIGNAYIEKYTLNEFKDMIEV